MAEWPQRVGSIVLLDPERAEFDDEVSRADLRRVLDRHPELAVLQTSRPVAGPTWDLIDREVLRGRPEITIRVFGHYGEPCDLSLVRRLPHLRRFEVDVRRATNVWRS